MPWAAIFLMQYRSPPDGVGVDKLLERIEEVLNRTWCRPRRSSLTRGRAGHLWHVHGLVELGAHRSGCASPGIAAQGISWTIRAVAPRGAVRRRTSRLQIG